MKVRRGFVSNSSTTSFVCEVCGTTESGYDGAGMEEYGYVQCEHEHCVCESDMLEGWHWVRDGEEEDEDYDRDKLDYIGKYVPSKYCPICQFEVLSLYDSDKYLKMKTGIEENEAFEDIKLHNKRRRKLYPKDYSNYVMKKLGIHEDDVLKEVKELCGGSYEELRRIFREKT